MSPRVESITPRVEPRTPRSELIPLGFTPYEG